MVCRRTGLLLIIILMLPLSLASTAYSTDFEGSESNWECHSPDQNPDICTTDATDQYVSPDESAKAHKQDGLCGIAGGISRDFSLSNQPESLEMELKAKADDWGSTAIYVKDSSGYHKIWEKYAGGSRYETGWMTKSFDISSYESDFRLIIGNDDDSQYCDIGDHSWWIWADDLSVTTAQSSPDKPSQLQPENRTVVESTPRQISAKYTDPDGDSGKLRFWDGEGNKIGSCSVADGQRCGVDYDLTHGDNYWRVDAVDSNGVTSQTTDVFNVILNQPPNQVSSPENPSEGVTVYDNSVDFSVTVSDPDGDSMDVEFLNNVSNASEAARTVSDVPDGGEASVQLSVSRGTTYNWWVRVRDPWETTSSGDWGFHVNALPELESVTPFDGAIHADDDVILNATATDQEQDLIKAYFYDSQGNFLGKDSGPDLEKLSSDIWQGLRLGKRYRWKINLSDGRENATYQPFSFGTSASQEYRVENHIRTDYSSIITSLESAKVVQVEVENKVSASKDLITYLSGVNAEFNENGADSISYSLDGYESREFLVTLRPQTIGEKRLTVTSENTRISVNSTESVPVKVRKVSQIAGNREVPGLRGVQLLLLAMSACIIYFRYTGEQLSARIEG